MSKDPKILILTGSYGNGHLKVSKTLKEIFIKHGMKQIVESDLYLDAHPLITKASKYLYIKSFTYGQRLYGMFYYGGNRQKKYFQADIMNYYGVKKLTHLVETLKPDLIVNTFPMLVVPQLRKKIGIPIVNVLTDFGLHKNWIHRGVDKYYVASENLRLDMMEKGIAGDKIKVTGIPIDADFERQYDKKLLFEKYHLDINKPVILIAAGAYGVLKDIKTIVRKLLNEGDSQIIVVCGKNMELRETLTIECLGEDNALIFGYTNKMDELMKMATIMVTKPGGITLSEALALQVPLLLYRSVPGQERENAMFLEEKGASIIVEHPDELIENITKLIQHENIRINMKENMKKLYHPNAAEVMCEDMITMVLSEKEKMNKVII